MKLREFLFATTLMSIALFTTKAAPTVIGDDYRLDLGDDARSIVEAKASVSLPAEPSPLISEDKVFRSAYYDTVSILRSNNPCSDFFGGPAVVDIFNELVGKLRKDVLSVGIGIRMSGPVTSIHNVRTQKSYRIFNKVSLNSRGPFYRNKSGYGEPIVPRVGSFEPNTKEARVLIFLHELGHVMKGSDGRWLLPDDGRDDELSRANSSRIEDVCDNQIHGLGKVTTVKALGKYKDPAQQLVPTSSESTQLEPRR